MCVFILSKLLVNRKNLKMYFVKLQTYKIYRIVYFK